MKFKSYQTIKLKKNFKTNDLIFLFHSSKLNLIKWNKIEQLLKELKLSYYKPLNNTNIRTFKDSVYKHFALSIGGFIIFLHSIYKTNELQLELLTKQLSNSFILIGVKLNNKIYSPSQMKNLNEFVYKKNIFIFHKSLDKHLKTSFVITFQKKNISK